MKLKNASGTYGNMTISERHITVKAFFTDTSCPCPFPQGRISGEGAGGTHPSPPEMTCGFLIQLVFCKKNKKTIIGVEVEQETSAPPPKENPGSAPVSLSLGKESPYSFSQFNLLNTDTFNGPSVSVLTGFDRIRFRLTAHLTTLPSLNPTLTLSFHLRQSSTDNILCEYKFVTAIMGKGKRKKE